MTGYYAAGVAGQSEFVEKKSRFITHVCPVATPAEAEAFVAQIKKQYPDARHHCWCYRTHTPAVERYSDDGEPQGTAGPPMLSVLQKEQIEDICVVVVRYFGGILLGTGGLSRAYSTGCADGVRVAGKYHKTPAVLLEIRVGYDRFAAVERLLEGVRHNVKGKDFTDEIRITVALPVEDRASVCDALREMSAGKIIVRELEQTLEKFTN